MLTQLQLTQRMALLMFVSVMRHTESSVKFWLITNFLSPSFKEFLPEMAKEYGFDYELVTYQWPHWLRGQKEKQRFIWGYKASPLRASAFPAWTTCDWVLTARAVFQILFLDVLFPLDLERVIFVDSDQIVRADMKELVDLDLQGAPYGQSAPRPAARHDPSTDACNPSTPQGTPRWATRAPRWKASASGKRATGSRTSVRCHTTSRPCT